MMSYSSDNFAHSILRCKNRKYMIYVRHKYQETPERILATYWVEVTLLPSGSRPNERPLSVQSTHLTKNTYGGKGLRRIRGSSSKQPSDRKRPRCQQSTWAFCLQQNDRLRRRQGRNLKSKHLTLLLLVSPLSSSVHLHTAPFSYGARRHNPAQTTPLLPHMKRKPKNGRNKVAIIWNHPLLILPLSCFIS